MELRHLRCLVAVSEERHFTRAAERLHIAQPALSQQIRRLEAELDVALVERTTRSVRMTEAGETLVAHARRILHESEVAVATLAELRGLERGRLAVGASQTMGAVDLSGLLAVFHRRFPSIELAVHEDLSVALCESLLRDELDLAFVTFTKDNDGLDAYPVASEPLVAIVAHDHPLAGRESLRIADLERENFVVFRRGATIRQLVEAAMRKRDIVPHVAFETNDVSRMRALVAAGLGVAVLPYSDAVAPGPAVAVVSFEDDVMAHTVFVAWRADRRHSPAALAFLKVVGDHIPLGPPR